MSGLHKDKLVFVQRNSNSVRITIPNDLGVELYKRTVTEDGTIIFKPQKSLDAGEEDVQTRYK
jgi:hypothetical protein